MRLVIDTNTLISGSLWQGPPARLISAALTGQAQMLELKSFAGIPIISATDALQQLGLS